MSGLSVIIPSRDVRNLAVSVPAVRRHEPDARIIIVDDGVDWRLMPEIPNTGPHYEVIAGVKPFVFARNCNLGIKEAGDDDVVLLNDDAVLESPRGFSYMRDSARDHAFGLVSRDHAFGLVSATTNLAGNPAQWRQRAFGVRTLIGNTPGNSFPTVAFVCVLIPRTTINAVGLLDERFTSYGWEDNDYCRRLKNAGLTIGIHDSCYVDHAKLNSTFRGQAYAAGDINDGREIYMKKWGTM